jgi:hypothetical protein
VNRIDALEEETRTLRADTEAAQARIDDVNEEISALLSELAARRADGWLPLEEVQGLAAERARVESGACAILERNENFDDLTNDEIVRATLGLVGVSTHESAEVMRARFDVLARR